MRVRKGAGLSMSPCYPWPPPELAGLSVAVPGRDLLGRWALEQVCTHSSLPEPGTRLAGVWNTGYLGVPSWVLEQAVLAVDARGGRRGQQEAQNKLRTSSQCQALGPQSTGTWNMGHWASTPAPAGFLCFFSQMGFGI